MINSDEKNATERGILYLVATPIGNLADISERAKKVLSECDFVAAEDTRNSGKLLMLYGIKKPLVSYFEHNKRERGAVIVQRILGGETCALITDAGMPAISDPGEDIVKLCCEQGIKVSVIPGACAAVSALTVSGLPTGRFVFEGFLSAAKAQRRKALEALRSEVRTIIFYEAPHKLKTTLDDMLEILGDRQISLCRELTKINEEIIRTTIGGAVQMYSQTDPRGEYVLVVSGCDAADRDSAFWSEMSIAEHVDYYIGQGMAKNDAMKACARDRGVGKSEIYSEIMIK